MSNKPKAKMHWWHLRIHYGPGRQGVFDEWRKMYDSEAEDWKDEKYSELAEWDQPAVVKLLEKGRPPKEVLENQCRSELRQFLWFLRGHGYLVVPKAKLPRAVRKMAADGQEIVLVASQGYKWKTESLAKQLGFSTVTYSAPMKLYVWTP